MENKSLIKINNCRIENSRGTVLEQLTWEMKAGEAWLVIGPNGGGKSSLARLIMGIEKPTSGKIFYNDTDITDYSVTESSFYQLTGEDRRVDFDKSQTETDFYDDYYLDEEYLKKTLIEVFYHKVKVETE